MRSRLSAAANDLKIARDEILRLKNLVENRPAQPDPVPGQPPILMPAPVFPPFYPREPSPVYPRVDFNGNPLAPLPVNPPVYPYWGPVSLPVNPPVLPIWEPGPLPILQPVLPIWKTDPNVIKVRIRYPGTIVGMLPYRDRESEDPL